MRDRREERRRAAPPPLQLLQLVRQRGGGSAAALHDGGRLLPGCLGSPLAGSQAESRTLAEKPRQLCVRALAAQLRVQRAGWVPAQEQAASSNDEPTDRSPPPPPPPQRPKRRRRQFRHAAPPPAPFLLPARLRACGTPKEPRGRGPTHSRQRASQLPQSAADAKPMAATAGRRSSLGPQSSQPTVGQQQQQQAPAGGASRSRAGASRAWRRRATGSAGSRCTLPS